MKDIATVVLSTLALVVSLLSYRRSKLTADRQYALAFCQDVARWAAEVLELLFQFEVITPFSTGSGGKFEEFRGARSQATSLLERGTLLFPAKVTYSQTMHAAQMPQSDHPVLRIICSMVEAVEEDRLVSVQKRARGPVASYRTLREEFILAVQKEIGVDIRYENALSVIKSKPITFPKLLSSLRSGVPING